MYQSKDIMLRETGSANTTIQLLVNARIQKVFLSTALSSEILGEQGREERHKSRLLGGSTHS